MSDLLNPSASPSSLDEKKVLRLNRLPLLFVLLLVVTVLLLLVYAVYQRGQQAHTDVKETITESDTEMTRKKLLEGYDNVDFIQPPAETPPSPAASIGTPVQTQAMGAVPTVEKPPELSEEERLRLQQLRDMENYRRDSLLRAVTAPTVVDTGKASASEQSQGASSDAGNNPQRLTALQQLQQLANGVGGGGTGDDPNGQSDKDQFSKTTRTYGYSDKQREPLISPYVLRVGSFIPAIMVSGINSDLPGEIIAQVSQDVRDTATGQYVLVPQGTKIIGSYSNRISYGQERVLLAWHRLSFPDGSVLELGNMGGVDEAGFAGVTDQVDRHTVETFQNATLLSVLSAGVQASQADSGSGAAGGETASQQMAAALGQQWSQVGMEMVKKGMNRQPTLNVRPGFRFNVFINKDMILRPY